MKKWFLLVVFLICSIYQSISHAAHPLITDDAGTMGKSNLQIEFNYEYGYDKEREQGVTIKEKGSEFATALTYGMTDDVDIVLNVPYQWIMTKEDEDVVQREDGLSDTSIEVKWRFYERDGLSLALKPGMTLPTGDYKDGLGQGRATYSVYFITTKEIETLAFHINLGYIRNENKVGERRDIWHASLAGEIEVTDALMAVANIGIERNPDRSSNTHPAFILGGLIYSITDNVDIDIGVKGGLNNPETDLSILAGLAVRF